MSIKLIWKEPPPPPGNHVRQKSTGFVYPKGVSGNSTFQKLYIASNRFT